MSVRYEEDPLKEEIRSSVPCNDKNKNNNNRYEYLLQQISQLNGDLHKTVAISTSLKEENEYLREKHSQMKQEVVAVQERYLQSQSNLLEETEAKYESDKRHEQLVQKWKRQLEQKAKEFEALRKQYAPPHDLGQLRLKIQHEVEGPHNARLESVNREVIKYTEMFYSVRREYEILKTEFETSSMDKESDMISIKDCHSSKVEELYRIINTTQAELDNTNHSDKIRNMEREIQTLQIKNRKLTVEVDDGTLALSSLAEELEKCKNLHVNETIQIREQMAHIKGNEISFERKVKVLEEENANVIAAKEEVSRQIITSHEECQRIKQQLQQKELLVMENHTSMNNRLMESRSEWERERSSLKEQLVVSLEKTATLEAAQNSWESTSKAKTRELSDSLHRINMDLEGTLRKTLEENESFSDKLRSAEEELRNERSENNTSGKKHLQETELLKAEAGQVSRERDASSGKLSTMQELLSKMKTECMTLRSKNKEIETEYKILQSKHRDAMSIEQESLAEKEQLQLKLQYMEEDLDGLHTKCYTNGGFENTTSGAEHQRDMERLTTKCATYKKKLLLLHDQNKQLKEKTMGQVMEMRQIKNMHSMEIQRVLQQARTHSTPVENSQSMEESLLQSQRAHREEMHLMLSQLSEYDTKNVNG